MGPDDLLVTSPMSPRRAVIWSLFMLPSFVLSGWLFLWLQWVLPTEGGLIEGVAFLTAAAIAGVVLGAVGRAVPSKSARFVLRVVVVVSATRSLLSEERLIGPHWSGAFHILRVHGPFLLVPALIGYVVSRVLVRFVGGRWPAPMIAALLPVLLVIAIVGESDAKWCWPWSSFRPVLVALESNAVAAAERQHLPTDRRLTREELERWQEASPLRVRLRFPITHWEVVASVVDPWSGQLMPDGDLWLWWGHKTFGPFDLKTMRMRWASD